MTPRRRMLLMVLALLLLALLSRGPAVFNDYISLDDGLLLTGNPILKRGLTLQGFKFAFTDAHRAVNWVPLTYISYMFDMQLFGVDAWGPHLTNVLLHAGSVLFLFLALRALTGSFWRSGAVAALLAVHPIHTESIAWVAERRDVLSLFFGALCLWAYACYARSSERRWLHYALAMLAFAASLMAKPMLVTLPCVLLLLDYWPLRRQGVWRLLAEKLPFFAGSVAISVVTYIAQQHAMSELPPMPPMIRAVNVTVAYAWYLYRLVWPTELPVVYPYRLVWPAWVVVAAPAGLALISMAVFLQRARRPWLLVGWLWFLGAMVPVIGLVQVGHAAFACRYAYFPFIGLYVAIVWSLRDWATTPRRRTAAAEVALGVLLLLTAMSIIEAMRWKDTLTLFTRTAAVAPDSVLTETDLAGALMRVNPGEAIDRWHRAWVLDPGNVSASTTLANFMLMSGRLDVAERSIRLARIDHPDDDRVRDMAGMLSLARGDAAAALRDFAKAAEVSPYNGLYRYHLARALEAAARYDDAAAADAA